MDAAISWYQRKIGTYDLQIWEKAVELQERKSKGMKIRHKQESSLKADLIDVDLVRGSTFSKNKPQHNVVVILWMGLVRMLLFPIFFHWWIQQTSFFVFTGFLILYILQIICVILYMFGSAEEFQDVPVSEVALPCVFMFVLGIIHCQVISTNFGIPRNKDLRGNNLQRRTLSKALLEPAESTDYKQTMSFVNSTVRDIDYNDNIDEKEASTHIARHNDKKGIKEFDHDPFWEDNDSCCESDSSCDDNSEAGDTENTKRTTANLSATALLPGSYPRSDHINVRIWEGGHWQKCHASLLDIGSMIVRKVGSLQTHSDDYILGILFPIAISLIPTVYRLLQHHRSGIIEASAFLHSLSFMELLGCDTFSVTVVVTGVFIQRLLLATMFFVMLCAAQQAFKKRLFYAKYFTHLTSSRRAKKSLIPHFRLNKVQNIKVWLSLRSYLRRRGPQRSVDIIVSSAFLCAICLLCFITVHLMNSSDIFVDSLVYWDCLVLLFGLGMFILHFITTGAKINKKYSSISTLLTEQINLHLQAERKPLKKENLQRANSVLTIASKLIKEIEEPFNIYGLAMNPILYNITRVLILSAFSGVVSEMLGFKLKLWKIKA